MPLFNQLRKRIRPSRRPEISPAIAYDSWAMSYDHQPDNLMLALDEQVVGQLLAGINLRGAVVVDVGCGTGRHWQKVLDQAPRSLTGFDVSPGMLDILLKKYPAAETHLLKDQELEGVATASCDLVLSTLTIAHILDIRAALTEWCRVLAPGGEMLLTDYHPVALARGGQRTFRDGDKVVAIRNHIYPLQQIEELTKNLRFNRLKLVEKKIDDSMRPYYEKQNALAVFRRFRGVPILYGLHLKKSDVAV